MDKIKPDTDALAKWVAKYKGPYLLSCKLDGVSGLYVYNAATKKEKLYTRGDGITGQDVSHIIPYLKLPKAQASATTDLALRGEFIIKKELFKEKYGKEFANPRNFVAGLINHKTPQPEKYKDLSFVVYELIQPVLKPSEQMKFVENNLAQVELVKYEVHNKISNELLSQTLINWRSSYDYEIDGIICINDEIYPRPKGNPDYAFAFKMVLSEQVAEAKVVDVLWAPSKDGYLKPRVQIEPINLGGVSIEYATGFNAKFIEDNSIGVGSLIRLIRSGDVIPHITEVIQPATEPLFPQEPYEWNATHVDIILKNKEENFIVKQKNITGFFKSIGVEGLSTGNVTRIMEAGYSTIPEIIALTEEDLLKVPGFKKKMASKLYEGIKEKINSVSLPELMHATNIFGRGFGTKKIEAILSDLPLILVDESPKQEKIKKVTGVQGLAKKTAEQFVNQLDEFIEFMKVANLKNKLTYTPKKPDSSQINTEHPLYKKKFVLTGFRDKDLVARLEAIGAEQATSVSKNTNIVIAKSIDEDTGKVAEAKKLGIEIATPEMLKEKYQL
jgi:NAD-dependent DNA ligase